MRFIADERHLVAGELLENTKRRLQEESLASVVLASKTADKSRFFKHRSAAGLSKKEQLELKKDAERASAILEEKKAVVQLLEVRTINEQSYDYGYG